MDNKEKHNQYHGSRKDFLEPVRIILEFGPADASKARPDHIGRLERCATCSAEGARLAEGWGPAF